LSIVPQRKIAALPLVSHPRIQDGLLGVSQAYHFAIFKISCSFLTCFYFELTYENNFCRKILHLLEFEIDVVL
jgi:hypothetical protein